MKSNCIHLLAFAALTLAALPADAQRIRARGVSHTEFHGWTNSLLVESRDALPRIIIVPQLGGRIMAYGVGDQNILWTNPDAAGQTLATAGPALDPGGFLCDIGPETARWPVHPELLLAPYEWSARRPYRVVLTSPRDETLRVELERDVQFDPTTGDVGFTHRLKNIGDEDTAYCLWHRIACQPGGFVLIPMNPNSRFPAGWSIQRRSDGRLTYDGTEPSAPGVRVMDGVLVAQTDSEPAKVGTDGNGQWAAYARGRTLFVVHFPVYSTATYSEGGNTATASWDSSKVELQPMSPEARLRPRRSYEFPLKWSLIHLPSEVRTPEEARALVNQIPGSPFL